MIQTTKKRRIKVVNCVIEDKDYGTCQQAKKDREQMLKTCPYAILVQGNQQTQGKLKSKCEK